MPYQDDLRRYFGEIARYAEPALTAGSAMVAEPVSGLAGLGALLSGRGVDGAAQSINAAQQAITYQPRTMEGQQGLQGLQAFLQPVGEVIQGASQNLGDKAYSTTGSPALAAAAYSAPTAFLEGLGLKGLNIARKPVGGADLYSARMGMGGIPSDKRFYHGTGAYFDEFSDELQAGGKLGKGFYFADNPEKANFFAKLRKMKDPESNPNIRTANLDIKNPYIIRSNMDLPTSGIDTAKLAEQGYDSVVMMKGDNIDEVVVFKSSQILPEYRQKGENNAMQ